MAEVFSLPATQRTATTGMALNPALIKLGELLAL